MLPEETKRAPEATGEPARENVFSRSGRLAPPRAPKPALVNSVRIGAHATTLVACVINAGGSASDAATALIVREGAPTYARLLYTLRYERFTQDGIEYCSQELMPILDENGFHQSEWVECPYLVSTISGNFNIPFEVWQATAAALTEQRASDLARTVATSEIVRQGIVKKHALVEKPRPSGKPSLPRFDAASALSALLS